MRRTKEEALQTREKILMSALDILSKKSYANASVSEIVENVGLSKGAFYWHFRNKNDLLVQLVEGMCRKGEGERAGSIEAPDTSSKLRVYFKESLMNLKNDELSQKIHSLLLRRIEWPEEVQDKVVQVLKESMQREQEMMEKLIVEGQKAGRIKETISSAKAATLMSSIFHGLCIMQMSGVLPENFTECTDLLFDAFTKEMRVSEKD